MHDIVIRGGRIVDGTGKAAYSGDIAIAGDKIAAFVAIGVKNHAHIQQAIKVFGGVYLGFQVQQNCIQEFDARQPWTPGPLTNDGHAVYATAYDATGVTVSGGKYVTRNVYLELTGGGREGPSAQVEWRVRKNLSIISRLGGIDTGRLAVRWRRDY